MICAICSTAVDDLKKFSTHLSSAHGLSSRDYTIKHFYSGIKPLCPVCGSDTRYVAFTYKKYCAAHAKFAMKEGGKEGGKAEAWNKGKTKETDDRLRCQSESMTGVNNPFYGHHHTQNTLEKISKTKTLTTNDLEERINLRSAEFECITPLSEYRSRQQQYLTFKCKKCGALQEKTLQAYERGSKCSGCKSENED